MLKTWLIFHDPQPEAEDASPSDVTQAIYEIVPIWVYSWQLLVLIELFFAA
jgi:hypothetical protein